MCRHLRDEIWLELLSCSRADVDGCYYGANWLRVDDGGAEKALLLRRVGELRCTFCLSNHTRWHRRPKCYVFPLPRHRAGQLEVASQILARFSSCRGATDGSGGGTGRCALPPSSLSSNPWWGHNLFSGSGPRSASSDRRVEWVITD